MHCGYFEHCLQRGRTLVMFVSNLDRLDVCMPLWCLVPSVNETVANTFHEVWEVREKKNTPVISTRVMYRWLDSFCCC